LDLVHPINWDIFGVILEQSLFSKGRGGPYVHELERELGRRRMNLKVAW
jgi:hypothetical protein